MAGRAEAPEAPAFDGADISDAEYRSTQDRLSFLGRIVDEMPLDAFLQRLEEAEALGSVLAPTLYREALLGGNLDAVRDVARAARVFQTAFRRARERLGKGEESETT